MKLPRQQDNGKQGQHHQNIPGKSCHPGRFKSQHPGRVFPESGLRKQVIKTVVNTERHKKPDRREGDEFYYTFKCDCRNQTFMPLVGIEFPGTEYRCKHRHSHCYPKTCIQ